MPDSKTPDHKQEEETQKEDKLKSIRLSGGSLDLRKYTNQIWLAGLGAFAKAEEEGSRFFDTLVDTGRDLESKTRDKSESRVEEIKEKVRHRTGETMDKMEKAFDERLNKALSRLGIPNKREVEALQRRVHELTAALDEMSSSESGKKKPGKEKG
ncbi:phasin family protein [Alcanivorax sp. JB21]|uniref:phasin family protein n=1 Tax=Alcanivorax limicola TaxID=2874102 RepID=UPI001CC0042C|nr:phasin family protein [Alcanivorax limicola]MBZ2188089.1 phasin family protein [Alcanivorax limicola]